MPRIRPSCRGTVRRRGAEDLCHFGRCILVCRAQCGGRPVALLASRGTDAVELLADGVGRGLRRIGKNGADLARLGLRILQRGFDERA